MRRPSVANSVEAPQADTAEERVALALRLGRQAAEDYALAHQVTVAEAQRVFRRNRQRGRLYSKVMRELDGTD